MIAELREPRSAVNAGCETSKWVYCDRPSRTSDDWQQCREWDFPGGMLREDEIMTDEYGAPYRLLHLYEIPTPEDIAAKDAVDACFAEIAQDKRGMKGRWDAYIEQGFGPSSTTSVQGGALQDAYDNGLPEDVHLTISGFLVPKPEHEVLGLLLKGHMPLYPIGFERIEAE